LRESDSIFQPRDDALDQNRLTLVLLSLIECVRYNRIHRGTWKSKLRREHADHDVGNPIKG
jgi:hypothetical protein